MFENKFSLGKKWNFKISLSYFATLNDSTEISNNYPNYNLLSKFSEIEDIMKGDNKELLKFFYFNRKKINEFIYKEEEIIEINSEIIKNKYIDYFYLALLIEDNINILNYVYNLDFIKEINDQIKGTNNDYLRELMMSKIIFVLIKNYKGTDEYDENDKSEIEELEKHNLERIEYNVNKLKDLNLKSDEIIITKIDEIYTGIIIDLIKTNKIDDIKYINNIIKQLDLENIYITKTIYDGLASILISDSNYMKRYKISSKKDLYNDDIINFYYILFKYILKKPIYIYHIPFLDEARKKILEIIKNDREKNDSEKLEYIIDFFTNNYYTILLNRNYTKKGRIKTNYNSTSTEVISEMPSKIKTKVSSDDNNNDIDNYSIIRFEENFHSSKNENYTRLIKEISNGYIIRLHNLNNITIYKKDFKNEIASIKFNSTSTEESTTHNQSSMKINFEESSINKIFEANQSINNIIETNESIEKKSKDFIQLMLCSKEGLMIYKLSNNQKTVVNTLNLSCTGCFEIKNKNYIIIGEKGLYHLEDLNTNKLKNYRIKEMPFIGCIKINDNYIALTSNSILPNGEDTLYIYDTNIKRFIKNIDHSFVLGVNGLNLMNILEEPDEKDKYDNKNQKENTILLCACKKYTDSQKNGIIIIDTNSIGEKKKLHYIFHYTDDFEVSCFCPLKIKINNKMKITNYFLAGGLDEEKKQGMIKLYKVQYNEKEKNDKINIEFLQDIVIERNEKFTGFNSNIECMMQCQSDGKIYISSSDGNLNLFSEPILDYYLEENQIFEELKIYF